MIFLLFSAQCHPDQGSADQHHAHGAAAGNELMISPRMLYREGWLDIADAMVKAKPSARVDYGEARRVKMPLLRKAARAFLAKKDPAFDRFRSSEGWWVEDYALFQALADRYNDSRWFCAWPKDLRNREPAALDKARAELSDEIDIYVVLQYFFRRQYMALKEYANGHGIRIIGDIPIFIAPDSSDAWTERKLLKIDADGQQEASSGVPPGAMSWHFPPRSFSLELYADRACSMPPVFFVGFRPGRCIIG